MFGEKLQVIKAAIVYSRLYRRWETLPVNRTNVINTFTPSAIKISNMGEYPTLNKNYINFLYGTLAVLQ